VPPETIFYLLCYKNKALIAETPSSDCVTWQCFPHLYPKGTFLYDYYMRYFRIQSEFLPFGCYHEFIAFCYEKKLDVEETAKVMEQLMQRPMYYNTRLQCLFPRHVFWDSVEAGSNLDMQPGTWYCSPELYRFIQFNQDYVSKLIQNNYDFTISA
jgi:hypothetical protein